MLKGRTTAWAGLMACLIGCGGGAPAPGPLQTAPTIVQTEHKLKLAAAVADDDVKRTLLLEVVRGFFGGDGDLAGACEIVTYLDTGDAAVRRAGVLVTTQQPAGTDCAAATGDATVTLRVRGSRETVERAEFWARPDAAARLELNLVHTEGVPEPGAAWSGQVTVGAAAPSDLAGLRALYEGALPELPANAPLSAGCRTAHRTRMPIAPNPLLADDTVDLVIWRPAVGEPAVAELSFRVEGAGDPAAASRAKELQEALGAADLLAAPNDVRSKTGTIYGCIK